MHKAQVFLNCINAKLWFQACFLIDFAFLYFLIFYPFLFSPYLYTLCHVLSYNLMHIHICRPKQTESCVGWIKEECITGHEWRMVALVTRHECSVVGSYSPALLWTHHPQVCHDHGRYFGQWNLSRVEKSLPNGSTIFCPTSWDADVMTGAGVAILDHR